MSELWSPQVLRLDQMQRPSAEMVPTHLKKQISALEPKGPLFFGIADTLYRLVDRLVQYKVLIISLMHALIIELSGAFALEDMGQLAQKR